MDIRRAILNGLILAALNIASIIAAYGIYYMVKPANQIVVQGPIAAILVLLGYAGCTLIAPAMGIGRWTLRENPEYVGAFFASLAASPLIFIPLHYATQGYLTSMGNIVATWVFQAPTNILALIIARKVLTAREAYFRSR